MLNFTDNVNIKGHLTISKVQDGSEEVIFDEKNVIVSGFGWSLAYMFSKLGSNNIADFQIDRFQLGVSGWAGNQVSSTFQLSGPLSSVAEYTTNGDSNIFSFQTDQYRNGTVAANQTFGKIPYSKVTKIDSRSVRYTIFLDEDSCNNLSRNGGAVSLNEIGLFVKNPRGKSTEESVLAAYKYFSPIRKADDFGLIFRWTITFG